MSGLACVDRFNSIGGPDFFPSSSVAIRDAQEQLNLAGAYPALKLDGVFGPKTERAILQFQAQNDLYPSGKLDADTLAALDSMQSMADDLYSNSDSRSASSTTTFDHASQNAANTAKTFVDAGVANDGNGYFAEAALLSGNVHDNLDVELMRASTQIGRVTEAHATMSHLTWNSTNGRSEIEGSVLTAHARSGAINPDGSIGFGVYVGAEAIGASATARNGADEISFGLSLGVGAGGHLGLRDVDTNGDLEVCAGLSVEFLSAGFCVELP
ncbi:MAG: peptidoglycan-binding domain-containing protein [Polyangiales bacterium]